MTQLEVVNEQPPVRTQDDAELFEYPLRQVDRPPAHHAVNRRDRAALDHPRDHLALDIIKLWGWPRGCLSNRPLSVFLGYIINGMA